MNKEFSYFKIKTAAVLILIIISSYIIVHLFAVFGVFLSLAYPIWWFFAPNQTICFLCRGRKDGEYCPFCKKVVDKSISISPENLSSAILNGLLIFILTIFSIGLIYLESKALSALGYPRTPKTVSFVIPSVGQYRLEEMFPMEIRLTGIKTPINTVQADISFDPNRLSVHEVSTDGSFASIFIQKEINNDAGYVRLTGGLPSPGYYGESGIFGTVYFKGLSPGIVQVKFLPSSMVLANDGKGTNVLKDFDEVSYLVLPEKISPEEEETQKEYFFSTSVLGKDTDENQMVFYDEEKVLGAIEEQPVDREDGNPFIEKILSLLKFKDYLIFNLYEKAFNTIKRLFN